MGERDKARKGKRKASSSPNRSQMSRHTEAKYGEPVTKPMGTEKLQRTTKD